jgi:hypothetical protein
VEVDAWVPGLSVKCHEKQVRIKIMFMRLIALAIIFYEARELSYMFLHNIMMVQ